MDGHGGGIPSRPTGLPASAFVNAFGRRGATTISTFEPLRSEMTTLDELPGVAPSKRLHKLRRTESMGCADATISRMRL